MDLLAVGAEGEGEGVGAQFAFGRGGVWGVLVVLVDVVGSNRVMG
jgi:hypothetical protein